MLIAPANAEDFSRIAEIEYNCFGDDAWSEDDLRKLDGVQVAWVPPRAGGFIAGYVALDASTGEISSLAVCPSFQRRGVGRALLEAVLHPGAFLHVRVGNEAAKSLYASVGMTQTDTVPEYYDDGEDAYIFTLL